MKIEESAAKNLPHHIVVKMQALYNSLKSAERKAADFILTSPDIVSSSAISVVADAAGCSEPTFVRLARKLGYTGYAEFKAELQNDDFMTADSLYKEFDKEDNYAEVTKKVFYNCMQALEDTLNIMNFDDYKKALEVISNCRRIVFFGVGDASVVARAAYHKFIRIGFDCMEASDSDSQIVLSTHLQPGDVALIISHSGRSRAVVNAAKQAKLSGATVIAITNYLNSPLTKNADISLLTASFAEHIHGEIVSKRVAELCILESLYINMIMNNEDLIDTIRKANQTIVVYNKV